jgi:hypothetical protein
MLPEVRLVEKGESIDIENYDLIDLRENKNFSILAFLTKIKNNRILIFNIPTYGQNFY